MTLDEAWEEIAAGKPTTLTDYQMFARHITDDGCSGCEACNLIEANL